MDAITSHLWWRGRRRVTGKLGHSPAGCQWQFFQCKKTRKSIFHSTKQLKLHFIIWKQRTIGGSIRKSYIILWTCWEMGKIDSTTKILMLTLEKKKKKNTQSQTRVIPINIVSLGIFQMCFTWHPCFVVVTSINISGTSVLILILKTAIVQ